MIYQKYLVNHLLQKALFGNKYKKKYDFRDRKNANYCQKVLFTR